MHSSSETNYSAKSGRDRQTIGVMTIGIHQNLTEV